MSAGRPKFRVTQEVCEEARDLASGGLAEYQIAAALGIHRDTLIEKKKEYSEFSDAIARGKAEGIGTITSALFEKAKGGDVPAIKYYLNNRDNENWKDKVYQDLNADVKVDDLSKLSNADLEKMASELEQKRAASKSANLNPNKSIT